MARRRFSPTPVAPPDPSLVTDETIRVAETKIEMMEAFLDTEVWAVQSRWLETRKQVLSSELTGLLRKLSDPKAQERASLEQLSGLQARVDENDRLCRWPAIVISMWKDQLAQMKEQQIRQGQA